MQRRNTAINRQRAASHRHTGKHAGSASAVAAPSTVATTIAAAVVAWARERQPTAAPSLLQIPFGQSAALDGIGVARCPGRVCGYAAAKIAAAAAAAKIACCCCCCCCCCCGCWVLRSVLAAVGANRSFGGVVSDCGKVIQRVAVGGHRDRRKRRLANLLNGTTLSLGEGAFERAGTLLELAQKGHSARRRVSLLSLPLSTDSSSLLSMISRARESRRTAGRPDWMQWTRG